ncbi:MAG: hypothetical protein LBU61_05865 [Coriobacteriales bacterium]|jgi:formamidopyrimidine-DNA glycosylase|nr:hypothetical protein [Coriobacteriales bacterium]
MIELPEARTIAKDLRKSILGKTITNVGGNFTDHKFTFYHDDPLTYSGLITGKQVTDIVDRNFYVEIVIEDYLLLFRDGANIRYYSQTSLVPPNKSKLLIEFDDGSCLNVTTSMYCMIAVIRNEDSVANTYYGLEINGVGALDDEFTYEYFVGLIDDKVGKLSIKGFLATEQRILGIGNGVVQDIMFNAELRPKRKVNTLNEMELRGLYNATVTTLAEMVAKGGRDIEKNIYGTAGGYPTILSSKSYKNGCPACGEEIIKEQFLGGSIYYCPNCQK